jgi:hypothetical protein
VGDQLTLSWPTNQLGFTLQISENVSPANWVESMFSPVVAGDRFWVTNPISAGPQFFRLKK